jgi:hypothetical protein
MQQIVVEVEDVSKAEMLLELLKALNFVNVVKASEKKHLQANTATLQETSDFFSLAGLWENREVSLESIRQKAWPKQ